MVQDIKQNKNPIGLCQGISLDSFLSNRAIYFSAIYQKRLLSIYYQININWFMLLLGGFFARLARGLVPFLGGEKPIPELPTR
jgi:hypothetical protein